MEFRKRKGEGRRGRLVWWLPVGVMADSGEGGGGGGQNEYRG